MVAPVKYAFKKSESPAFLIAKVDKGTPDAPPKKGGSSLNENWVEETSLFSVNIKVIAWPNLCRISVSISVSNEGF